MEHNGGIGTSEFNPPVVIDQVDVIRDNRSDRLRSAFSGNFEPDGKVVEIKQAFKKYEDLLSRESRTWWDLKALEKYLENNMIPRGLRLEKNPTTTYDGDFVKEWQEILSQASLKLIKLIIRHEKIKIDDLGKQILDTKMELEQYKLDRDYQSLMDRTASTIEKLEQDLIKLKRNKYERDLVDYQNDMVYSWKQIRPARSRSRGRSRSKAVYFNRPRDGMTGLEHETTLEGCPTASQAPKNEQTGPTTRARMNAGLGPNAGGAAENTVNPRRRRPLKRGQQKGN